MGSAGRDVHGDFAGGDSIRIGDIRGSQGVAIGRGAQAHVSHTVKNDHIEGLFDPVHQAIQSAGLTEAVRADLVSRLMSLRSEVEKGDDADVALARASLAALVERMPSLSPVLASWLVRTSRVSVPVQILARKML